MAHLRRLGILAVFVPARMTWLLQLLDVYGFATLKAELRSAEARARLQSPTGIISSGDWMRMATSAIRRCVINRDFSSLFRRLGTAESPDEFGSGVKQYLGDVVITPRLPTIVEFARLISRPSESPNTRALHAMAVGSLLRVKASSLDTQPPAGAVVDLPTSLPAFPLPSKRRLLESASDADCLENVLDQFQAAPPVLHAFRPARNFRPVLEPPADE